MGEESPKVSVCISSYNYGHFIADAIQSVLTQTFQDFELIILDNLSTDDSKAAIGSFRDRRIRFHEVERRIGLYAAWNRLLSLASGQYVVAVAADDMLHPEMLERESRILDLYPNVGMVFSKVKVLDENGKIRGEWGPLEKQDYVRSGEAEFERLVFRNDIAQPSVMVRKQCHELLGGYDEAFPAWADYKMWLTVALHYDIAFVSMPLAYMREHEGRVTSRAWRANTAGMEGYMLIKNVFVSIPEEKSHLRSLQPRAERQLAQYEVSRAFANLSRGESKLARRNIALAVAIDHSILGRPSPYLVFLLTLLGNAGGRLVGRLTSPLVKAYRTGGRVSRLVSRL